MFSIFKAIATTPFVTNPLPSSNPFGASQDVIDEITKWVVDKKSFFSDASMAGFAAEKYMSAFEQSSKIGNTIADITSTSASGSSANVAKTAYDFLNVVIANLFSILQPTAIAIVAVIFAITVAHLAMEDRFTAEIFMKHFAKLAVGVALVIACPQLTALVIDFGTALGNLVAGANLNVLSSNTGIITTGDIHALFLQKIQDGTLNKWSLFFNCFGIPTICSIVGYALMGVTYVIVFSRLLEMSVRAAGMPLAVAFFADDGMKGSAGRYMKKFAAVCCQGVFLILIGKVTAGLMTAASYASISGIGSNAGDVTSDLASAAVIIIGVGVASIKAMYSSINFANDLFGV